MRETEQRAKTWAKAESVGKDVSPVTLYLLTFTFTLAKNMSSLDGNEIYDINCMYGQTLVGIPQVEGNPQTFMLTDVGFTLKKKKSSSSPSKTLYKSLKPFSRTSLTAEASTDTAF